MWKFPKEKYKNFLIKDGLGERAAGDYVSRCLRVERDLKVNLEKETENFLSYVLLIRLIRAKYKQEYETGFKALRVAAQLVSAVRRFAEFRWGKRVIDHYPRAHGGKIEKLRLASTSKKS
jgi:hypothetical protein